MTPPVFPSPILLADLLRRAKFARCKVYDQAAEYRPAKDAMRREEMRRAAKAAAKLDYFQP